MVDILGRQDHGSQPGIETPETVVSCDRNHGEFMALKNAQESYLPYACNPNSHGNIGQCKYQKPCLALRLHIQQEATVADTRGDQQSSSLNQLIASTIRTSAFWAGRRD